MAETVNELVRLAEEDGATFQQTPTGAWWAKDRDGAVVIRGALSKVEAAVLYCEDRGLDLSTPEAILARICHEYRPYDTMPEFRIGFDAYLAGRFSPENPYGDGVAAQAWDRGANTAMQYQRAMWLRGAHPEEVEKAGPGWLDSLLHRGRV